MCIWIYNIFEAKNSMPSYGRDAMLERNWRILSNKLGLLTEELKALMSNYCNTVDAIVREFKEVPNNGAPLKRGIKNLQIYRIAQEHALDRLVEEIESIERDMFYLELDHETDTYTETE